MEGNLVWKTHFPPGICKRSLPDSESAATSKTLLVTKATKTLAGGDECWFDQDVGRVSCFERTLSFRVAVDLRKTLNGLDLELEPGFSPFSKFFMAIWLDLCAFTLSGSRWDFSYWTPKQFQTFDRANSKPESRGQF